MVSFEKKINQEAKQTNLAESREFIKHSVYFENGEFWHNNENGRSRKISLSAMIADLSLGIKYELQATDSVEAKNRFSEYLKELEKMDNQLKSHLELAKFARETTKHIATRKAYNAIAKRLEKEINGEMFFDVNETSSIGLLGERLVESILKKVVIEAQINLTVLRANPIQDVEGKVDLVLHRENKNRGVEISLDENRKDIGFQLIVAGIKNQRIKAKERGIERVLRKKVFSDNFNDIIQVRIPPNKIKKAFLDWINDGRLPGGPMQYLTEYERRFIANQILQLLSGKEYFITEEELRRLNEVKMIALI